MPEIDMLGPRGRYIVDSLKALRERQAIELERAVQFFGEEWDKEHVDE